MAPALMSCLAVLCAGWQSTASAQSPDLTITKTHVGNFTQSQNAAIFTITVTNSGTGAVASGNSVIVTDTLPGGLTATAISGSAWSCTQPGGPCSRDFSNTVLAAGASYPPLTLTVNVAPNAPALVTNTVTVSGGGEVNTGNNSASDPTTIGAGPDLHIAVSHVGNFTQSQNQATYTITVDNVGVGAVQSGNSVIVTDTLPGGLTATALSGSAWSCTQPAGPCSRDFGNTVLAAGASYPPLTLTVNVANNAPALVTNSVTVSGGGELNTTNNAASDPTTIGAGPDLHIAISHVGNFTQSQNQATYTITVDNVGVGAVQSGNSVVVTDTLPGGLTATALSGSAWSCTQPGGPCSRDFGNTVLAAGASYPPLTLTVNVANNAPALVTNNVTVSGGGELNTTNNAAADPTTIGPGPDLTITKTHVGNFYRGQIGATYTITVGNAGPGAVQSGNSVLVTDTLPAGLTATALSGSAWSCTQPGGPCSRDFGNTVLAAGASYPPLTLTVTVAANAPTTVINNVTVSGGGELNTANDAASDPTFSGPTLDIDNSIAATKYDPLTDGVLVIRYMLGLTGPSLTTGALGGTALRIDPTTVKTYLDVNHSALDIDGDGNVDAATDGVLILRYLFGLRGDSLIQGALGAGATRTTALLIEGYLATLVP